MDYDSEVLKRLHLEATLVVDSILDVFVSLVAIPEFSTGTLQGQTLRRKEGDCLA